MAEINSSSAERYEIHITSTARSYRPDDEYRIIDQQKMIAHSIDEVREKLLDLYGHCKREPIYVDTLSGDACQVGWIYCFNNDENIRGQLQKWRQQDWVSVMKLMGEVLDPRQLKR